MQIFPTLNRITSTLRVQGSVSGEDTRFPTMWPRFDYQTWGHNGLSLSVLFSAPTDRQTYNLSFRMMIITAMQLMVSCINSKLKNKIHA